MSRVTRPTSQLAGLNLNLLVALRELIRERNVTKAAERLGVTQPAASATLSRLRRHFGDELLVRVKGSYELTPVAASLAGQLEAVCAAAERLMATTWQFDPETSDREFTFLMADYTIAMIGERLSQLVHTTAPRMGLHVRLVRESLTTEYVEMIRFIDGMVVPVNLLFRAPGIRSVELFRDRWVCVASGDNPAFDTGAVSMDELSRLPWVAPYHQRQGYPGAPIAQQLRLLGIEPRVAVRVESYLSVPYFVVGTDRIALMQERLAMQFADRLGLRVLECPSELPPIKEAFWWHERYDEDPAHAWMRGLLAEAARRPGRAPAAAPSWLSSSSAPGPARADAPPVGRP
ncbi:MAG: LysR family transcriptional regulator [Acidimicrobiales bacterium]